jgi:hypothetical protein
MILAAALLLLHPMAVTADSTRNTAKTAVSEDNSAAAPAESNQPMTMPAGSSHSFFSSFAEKTPAPVPAAQPAAEAPAPDPAPQPFVAVTKTTPAGFGHMSTKKWWALSAAMHGAATFDAWSTRRFMSNGTGQELNPMFRPFAKSNAIYAATQAVPVAFDFLSRHMLHSENRVVRRFWWAPQSIATASSFACGIHNLGIH